MGSLAFIIPQLLIIVDMVAASIHTSIAAPQPSPIISDGQRDGVAIHILRGIGKSTSSQLPSRTATTAMYNGTCTTPSPRMSTDSMHITALVNVSEPTLDEIPGLVTSSCVVSSPPSDCVAICNNNDTSCFEAASSYISPCASSWSSYDDVRRGIASTGSGWSYHTALEGQTPYTSSTVVTKYTSFSSADATFVEDRVNSDGNIDGQTTIVPVYAVGNPIVSTSVITMTGALSPYSFLTAPTPTCKYMGVWPQARCGQCTLTGGTVQLYYWPSSSGEPTIHSNIPRSTVLDGTTLYSPTVYISLQSVHAQDSCTQVGNNHSSTIISLSPQDVSTQVHIGGQVFASGANQYGRLNYSDLTGLPVASQYEMQPSCQMFGCETIFPTVVNPTLVVPSQLRSLDSA